MNIFSDLLLATPKPKAKAEAKQRRGIEIKSEREIEIMRQSSKIVATVLKEIYNMVEPGMTTAVNIVVKEQKDVAKHVVKLIHN